MKIICAAICEDERQRENLCQCINILGGIPLVNGDVVIIEYDGNSTSEFVELFEQYPVHEIHIRN